MTTQLETYISLEVSAQKLGAIELQSVGRIGNPTYLPQNIERIPLEDAARKHDVPIDLPELEALALIRATYADDDGGWASLDDARLILDCIMDQE